MIDVCEIIYVMQVALSYNFFNRLKKLYLHIRACTKWRLIQYLI